jgi:hypothetical protein
MGAERHLLQQITLRQGVLHLGPHVRHILREQGIHQTHELASGEHEGSLVLELGRFGILSPVEGFVLKVELA